MIEPTDALNLLDDLIAKAKAAGAEAADALMVGSVALSHAQRLGQVERLEREESQDLGLRVLIGKRQAMASTTDASPAALAELVERAVAMAGSVPEDSFCGLAAPGELARELPELEICDEVEPGTELLIERARACEEAARAVAGVTNSEGAEASWSFNRIALAGSNGFAGTYSTSGHGLAVSVLAGEGLKMERDYEFSSVVYGADLDDPEAIGQRAGERAVRRLGARKAATGKVPVVFDPRVSGGLLRHMASAINGNAVARGTSFLKDKLGERIFAQGITVIDDPHRPRGLRSKPVDGEGVANGRRKVIDDGVLTTWILDLRSARQLGLPGAHGRHRPGVLRERDDGHGRERGNRRLQPRRRRFLDRAGRARLSGERDDRGRQSQRYVHEPLGGQRPGVPLRHQRADPARGGHDRGRCLVDRI
jgi:PmbA protein